MRRWSSAGHQSVINSKANIAPRRTQGFGQRKRRYGTAESGLGPCGRPQFQWIIPACHNGASVQICSSRYITVNSQYHRTQTTGMHYVGQIKFHSSRWDETQARKAAQITITGAHHDVDENFFLSFKSDSYIPRKSTAV